ncbi:N-acetylglucosamine-6-phosphate deacetylase [Martelella endophytica]|uniref:N-acetylglucosamine-6-phosphate deacetylase n=1 Tax=Martelella endophytica TaxID=1486262 RepID=A0A0D5LL58_MAREN|nr:N-acetylglucosamine-6-phosphate deacetylase [Martelella endophytica]AJY44705.1 N-acetylglucosamine-6-phosphate deacetylase [Martelella endophytica]
MKKAVTGARIFDGTAFRDGLVLVVDGDRIEAIARRAPHDAEIIDAAGKLVVPGFIDLQVNGGGGVLLNNDPSLEGLETICRAPARFGTTALLPTLITDRPEVVRSAVAAGRAAKDAGVPGFLGLHLEGPHLSLARKGTHDPALIRPMDAADYDFLIDNAGAFGVGLLTVAPESVKRAQVSGLAGAGYTVSLGHTDTDYATAREYVTAGASMVTHLFNAMSPLTHREPGVVGAALSEGALNAGLIADGFHVDRAAMGIAIRAKLGPGKIFLVTDAMSVTGTDLQSFELNGRTIYRKGGRLTLADGTLAGADTDMLTCLKNCMALGVALEEALRMASAYPAAAVGVTSKGTLAPGLDADFLILSEDLTLSATYIGGELAFSA